MPNFLRDVIDVTYHDTDMGPYPFGLTGAAPRNATLAAVTVRSFSGKVVQGDDIDDETESTSVLIDSTLSDINGNYGVDVYFNYPGDAYVGNHSIVMEITWSNGAQSAYYFYRVRVHE